MKVSEIMRTVLVTVTMDHTIEHARKIMKMKHIRHLLVVDGSKLVGIVTDRDVRSHVSPRVGTPIESTSDKATLESKLHQVMTRDLITVSPDTPVSEAFIALSPLTGYFNCLGISFLPRERVSSAIYRE